ncbi:hypothetical protein RJT34_32453 [Clitoria ternatea]|uniref:Uncharacterized protein n=1 Tax=Clitoria ternatea TaxID=43366 RepID=A0AAN9EYB5_CLITE
MFVVLPQRSFSPLNRSRHQGGWRPRNKEREELVSLYNHSFSHSPSLIQLHFISLSPSLPLLNTPLSSSSFVIISNPL